MTQIRQFIEQTGIYIFFVSLFLFTQTNWMRNKGDYKHIEIRFLFAFFVGIILSWVIIKLFKKITGKANIEQEMLSNNISIALSPVRQFIEQTGIYIFFVSLFLFTQTNWMRNKGDYKHIEIRFLFAFFVGIILSWVIIKLFKKITGKANIEQEMLLNNISMALFPGIFFVFGSINKVFFIVGAILCLLVALYIWVKPFRDYVHLIIFIGNFNNMLIVEDGKACIDMEGTYEKDNLQAKQAFLIDLISNFYECSEMKINEVNINFSNLRGIDENELKPVIESVSSYFNLRIIY